jgi:nucleotide-binding universal stress UspA family protein
MDLRPLEATMKTILACLDFSDVSQTVAEEGARVAKEIGARLVLFHAVRMHPPVVVGEGSDGYVAPIQDLTKDTHAAAVRLRQMADPLARQGIRVGVMVHKGGDIPALLATWRPGHPEMIVIGSHGHGALRHLLGGGTSERAIRKASCPVLVVSPKAAAELTATPT